MRSHPMDIPRIVTLSRATCRKMLQPLVGGGLMSASTVIVAITAQFLRRVEL